MYSKHFYLQEYNFKEIGCLEFYFYPAEHLIVILTEIKIARCTGKTFSSLKVTARNPVLVNFFIWFLGVYNAISNVFPPNEDVCCEIYLLDGKVSIAQHSEVYKEAK